VPWAARVRAGARETKTRRGTSLIKHQFLRTAEREGGRTNAGLSGNHEYIRVFLARRQHCLLLGLVIFGLYQDLPTAYVCARGLGKRRNKVAVRDLNTLNGALRIPLDPLVLLKGLQVFLPNRFPKVSQTRHQYVSDVMMEEILLISLFWASICSRSLLRDMVGRMEGEDKKDSRGSWSWDYP